MVDERFFNLPIILTWGVMFQVLITADLNIRLQTLQIYIIDRYHVLRHAADTCGNRYSSSARNM
jgi:hypothetical protein